MSPQRVLVVDDERNIRRTLKMVLSTAGYDVSEAESGEEGVAAVSAAPVEVVLLDVNLPGQDGLVTLEQIRSLDPAPMVIMISGQATVATAVEATRLGACDFLEKPLSKDRVLVAIRNAVQRGALAREVKEIRTTEARRHVMIGDSAAIDDLRRQIEKVSPTPATVLVTGESGGGKEVVARMIHDTSGRRDGPFVKVNCAAIPEALIESELFGCVKGAFTGADRARDGKFLVADGGTIFLDEIGDMSLKVQAKVLRALQEREIERVGDSSPIRVDVRVVAATNKDLTHEVSAGSFREDLFYRLNVVPLEVPPLRARTEDIPRLAVHFLQLYAAENQLPVKVLGDDAKAALSGRKWRGNVRELKNVVERLAILSDGPEITEIDVARHAPGGGPAPPGAPAAAAGGGIPSLDAIREMGGLAAARREFEKACIEMSLREANGNVSQAARSLGVERSNLHKKMQTYDLAPARGSKGSEDDHDAQ